MKSTRRMKSSGLMPTRSNRHRGAENPARRGSTLMIVLALLALLSLLGVVFFTISAQEESSARYFMAEDPTEENLSPDVLWDWALEQLTVGPRPEYRNSALWGRRYAMTTTALGTDVQPHSGQGVRLMLNVGNVAVVDQDFNGGADGDQSLLSFADSPVAWGGQVNNTPIANGNRPSADVDYTYPDINNLFLAYKGYTLDSSNNPVLVIIPSFHRPQYLRTTPGNANGATLAQQIPTDWYQNTVSDMDGTGSYMGTGRRLLRPHPDHIATFNSATATAERRFIVTNAEAASLNVDSPFPFVPSMTGGTMGVWTNSATPATYELDVDNDGDGIKEGVWLDLDFPVQERGDGKLFVPLFSFTVYSADGLFNLNTHGNIDPLTTLSANPFGGGAAISQSNQGISPAEVNPQWGLTAGRLGTDLAAPAAEVFQQHEYFFGHAPSPGSTAGAIEAANMEWWFLLMGRPQFKNSGMQRDISDLFPGRYGELDRLYNGVATRKMGDFPWPGFAQRDDNANLLMGQYNLPFITAIGPDLRPGVAGTDDDGNGTTDDASEIGWPGSDDAFPSPYGSPMSFGGWGDYVNRTAGQVGKNVVLSHSNVANEINNPSRWLQYTNYDKGGIPLATQVPWGRPSTQNGQLMITDTNLPSGLFYDTTEMIHTPGQLRPGIDDVFGADEMAFLHLSETTLDETATTSRLQKLAPFNFSQDNNARATAIRKLFSTQSADRKQYGFQRLPISGAPLDRGMRTWEFSSAGTQNGTTLFRFPPDFGGGSIATHDFHPSNVDGDPANVGSSAYPFRPALQHLIEMLHGSATGAGAQRKLNVNRLITRTDLGSLTYDQQVLHYRPLTDHVTDVALTTVPAAQPANPYPRAFANTTVGRGDQEWWARRDRQQMCRDIYVLLYLLSCGDDTLDPTTLSNADAFGSRALYSEDQLQEMAQFAVNVVDALDRDNVITLFEYDTDLSNGWGMNDTPFNTSDDSQPADRAVVYGVEHQQLTFSEVLQLRTQAAGSNDNKTLYDDIDEFNYLFIELRNASPVDVPLSIGNFTAPGNSDKGIWRIRYKATDSMGNPVVGDYQTTGLTFLSGSGTVRGGGLYSIGTRDGNNQYMGIERPSDFRVDHDGDGDFDLIVPNVPDANPYTTASDPSTAQFAPKVDLDLRHDRDRTKRDVEAATLTPLTSFVSPNSNYVLVLERRLNPGLPQVTDNTWVTVDEFEVVAAPVFNISGTMADELAKLKSTERNQPLNRQFTQAFQPFGISGNRTNDAIHFNTIYSSYVNPDRNSSSPTAFTLWQPHFDRDFASLGELFSIPLYGPDQLTYALSDSGSPPRQELGLTAGANYSTDGDMGLGGRSRPLDAGTNFLQPQHPDNTDGLLNDPTFVPNRRKNNRWYRLLEFLDVPSRLNQHATLAGRGRDGQPGFANFDDDFNGVVDDAGELGWFGSDDLAPEFNQRVVQGKIDLNNIRHPEVLAGLLDDDSVFSMTIDAAVNGALGLPGADVTDVIAGTVRDWWAEFLRSRDRWDPVTTYFLPGMPNSKPFRGFGHTAHPREYNDTMAPYDINAVSGLVDQTILRRLPGDTDGGGNSSKGDGSMPPTASETNRLLFEVGSAADHGGNAVNQYARHRLLSKLMNNTTTRSNVFIVYISVEFFEAGLTTQGAVRIGGPLADSTGHRGFFVVDRSAALDAYDPASGTFDFRQMIKHRLTIR